MVSVLPFFCYSAYSSGHCHWPVTLSCTFLS
jgi:hypothetical protein